MDPAIFAITISKKDTAAEEIMLVVMVTVPNGLDKNMHITTLISALDGIMVRQTVTVTVT